MNAYPKGKIEVIEIILNKDETPTSFNNKVEELLEQGVFETREQAERWVETSPITLELMYEKHHGLFAVESEAVECGLCFSPYTKEDIKTDD